MEVNVWVTSFVAKKQKMKQSECYKRMIERMKDQKKTKKMRSKKKNKTSPSYRDRQDKNNFLLILL